MDVTLEQLRAGLTLGSGQPHTLTLKRIPAHFLQLTSPFELGSVVLQPSKPSAAGVLPLAVLARVLRYAESNAGKPLLVAAHTGGSAGVQSERVTQLRADALRAFLCGERTTWSAVAGAHHTACDLQSLLAWSAREHGFACDPGATDGIVGPKTRAALSRFRKNYNREFAGHLDGASAVGPDDWQAFFDLQQISLAGALDLPEQQLPQIRQKLQFLAEPTLGCAASFPSASAGVPRLSDGPNGRVDFVFFDDPGFPSLLAQEPPGYDLYATPLRFRRTVIAPASPKLRSLRLDVRVDEACRYALRVGAHELEGDLGPGESLVCDVSEAETSGELSVWPARFESLSAAGDEGIEWQLEIGTLPDVSTPSGAQARLDNLGYVCGDPDGDLNELLRSALLSFQEGEIGASSGRLDDRSQEVLRRTYGA